MYYKEICMSEDKKIRLILFLCRLLSQTENFVELDNRLTVVTGWNKCDMYKGPCSCGAWHKPGDMEKIILKNLV